eukprot:TRINITY_DN3597_c0_g2_i2.p1 TRINITY_DN3597_c0_g2~~TRINITY_DN3597_c0_g2_i2.p1  ORF type:complete len:435 (-),score=81.51 TRINITY_DN3597_c0_g2_i2:248-1420(-)
MEKVKSSQGTIDDTKTELYQSLDESKREAHQFTDDLQKLVDQLKNNINTQLDNIENKCKLQLDHKYHELRAEEGRLELLNRLISEALETFNEMRPAELDNVLKFSRETIFRPFKEFQLQKITMSDKLPRGLLSQLEVVNQQPLFELHLESSSSHDSQPASLDATTTPFIFGVAPPPSVPSPTANLFSSSATFGNPEISFAATNIFGAISTTPNTSTAAPSATTPLPMFGGPAAINSPPPQTVTTPAFGSAAAFGPSSAQPFGAPSNPSTFATAPGSTTNTFGAFGTTLNPAMSSGLSANSGLALARQQKTNTNTSASTISFAYVGSFGQASAPTQAFLGSQTNPLSGPQSFSASQGSSTLPRDNPDSASFAMGSSSSGTRTQFYVRRPGK